MSSFTAACVQMNAPPLLDDSIDQATQLIRQAVAQGATLIVTPENTSGIVYGKDSEARRAALIHDEDNHPALSRLTQLAAQHRVTLVIGSLIVRAKGAKKPTNRCYVINDKGIITHHYDKIHLFDACVSSTEQHTESDFYEAGRRAVVASHRGHGIGLTICYDVRFPALFQSLSACGVLMITVPAAFTRPTGEAHWHCLLKARAIENACYILASAQCGTHDGGRKTWGHSMIIDPWGECCCSAGENVGVITALIDPHKQQEALARVPVLNHRRAFDAATM